MDKELERIMSVVERLNEISEEKDRPSSSQASAHVNGYSRSIAIGEIEVWDCQGHWMDDRYDVDDDEDYPTVEMCQKVLESQLADLGQFL